MRGQGVLPGARESLKLLEDRGVPFVFVTNGGGERNWLKLALDVVVVVVVGGGDLLWYCSVMYVIAAVVGFRHRCCPSVLWGLQELLVSVGLVFTHCRAVAVAAPSTTNHHPCYIFRPSMNCRADSVCLG